MKPSYNSEAVCRDFSLNASDFVQYLPQQCSGEFLDCENEKISKDDIEALLTKTDPPTVQNNKRQFPDTPSSNEPAKKFVFRQANPGPVSTLAPLKLPPRTLTALDRSADDGLKVNDKVRGLFVPNYQHDASHQQHPVTESRNERNFVPPSNSTTPPLFAFDRTKKSSEPPNTNRDNNSFITAREELLRRQALKGVQNVNQPRPTNESNPPLFAYGKSTKTLGLCRSVHSKFVPPITPVTSSNNMPPQQQQSGANNGSDVNDIDPRLKNIEPKMIELIQNEIMHQSSSVGRWKKFLFFIPSIFFFCNLQSLLLTTLQIGMT